MSKEFENDLLFGFDMDVILSSNPNSGVFGSLI
jgi:hypothetical protein